MKVTIRDLFNYDNPASTFKRYCKDNKFSQDDLLPEDHPDYGSVLEAKQNGELEGEQWRGKDNDEEI